MTKEIVVKDDNVGQFNVFFPPNIESSRLLVGCAKVEFSASRIARAVEDADAQLLNLNVTSLEIEGWQVVVALRVNHRNPQSVARSLERYGYDVINFEVSPDDDEKNRLRYDELMHYLSM